MTKMESVEDGHSVRIVHSHSFDSFLCDCLRQLACESESVHWCVRVCVCVCVCAHACVCAFMLMYAFPAIYMYSSLDSTVCVQLITDICATLNQTTALQQY